MLDQLDTEQERMLREETITLARLQSFEEESKARMEQIEAQWKLFDPSLLTEWRSLQQQRARPDPNSDFGQAFALVEDSKTLPPNAPIRLQQAYLILSSAEELDELQRSLQTLGNQYAMAPLELHLTEIAMRLKRLDHIQTFVSTNLKSNESVTPEVRVNINRLLQVEHPDTFSWTDWSAMERAWSTESTRLLTRRTALLQLLFWIADHNSVHHNGPEETLQDLRKDAFLRYKDALQGLRSYNQGNRFQLKSELARLQQETLITLRATSGYSYPDLTMPIDDLLARETEQSAAPTTTFFPQVKRKTTQVTSI